MSTTKISGTIKTISMDGYVKVKVGTKHHLADSNGYAYEHRLVAEQMLGRRLLPGEIVHHRNEDRDDNRPENLEVLTSIAEHKVRHRSIGNTRRLPGEPNPQVKCACGCGHTFLLFDASGRRRKSITGHSLRKGTGKRNDMTMVLCACGCGMEFRKYDAGARERRFINGHNRSTGV